MGITKADPALDYMIVRWYWGGASIRDIAPAAQLHSTTVGYRLRKYITARPCGLPKGYKPVERKPFLKCSVCGRKVYKDKLCFRCLVRRSLFGKEKE